MVLSVPCRVNRRGCLWYLKSASLYDVQGRKPRGRNKVKHYYRFAARLLGLAGMLSALLLLAPTADAVQVEGLYRTTVPVADRSATALAAAFTQAFTQVLIKVTGNTGVAANPALAAALQQPAQYIQQYAYQQPAAPPAGTATAPPGSTPGLSLSVSFDPPSVDTLLQTANLPLWGQERPLVVMWVGVDQSGARFIVGSDGDPQNSGARIALQQAADARGLPVLFPLLDLQDQGAVSFADLDGGFMDTVIAASARYEANAEVAGVVRRAPTGQWLGQWWLAFRGRTDHWTTLNPDLDTALASGVGGVADRLAGLLAVTGQSVPGAPAGPVRVAIAGVGKVKDYARIEGMLEHLAPISAARLVKVTGDQLVFDVVPRGNPEDVARNLALVSWLTPEPAPATPVEPVPTMPNGALPAATTAVTLPPNASAVQPAGMQAGLPASATAVQPAGAPVAMPSNATAVTTPVAVSPPAPVQTFYFRYQP